MDAFFEIVDVLPIGDADSGEAHIVTLHHHCREGEPIVTMVRFGKFLAAAKISPVVFIYRYGETNLNIDI